MFRQLRFDLAYLFRPPWDTGISPPELIAFIASQPPGRALDLGCGTGQLAQLMIELGKNFILGIDFSPVAIDYAKQLINNGNFVIADLYKPETYENLPEYDCIVMSEVMEHLENDITVLNFILPETHLIFTVPNYITDSHVRGFRSEQEVHDRYDKYVEIKSLDEVVLDDKNNWKVWIVDGMNK